MVGCVAMHVFKTLHLSDYQNGEILSKKTLKQYGVLDLPYKFIKTYGPKMIGVGDLPKALFSKEYLCPAVNSENIGEKIQAAESMLQEHGIDISINFYVLAENRVNNRIVSSTETVSATRVMASVVLLEKSRTSRPRHHNSSFNLVLSSVSGGKQFHCWNCLNVGKFMYHNMERF